MGSEPPEEPEQPESLEQLLARSVQLVEYSRCLREYAAALLGDVRVASAANARKRERAQAQEDQEEEARCGRSGPPEENEQAE